MLFCPGRRSKHYHTYVATRILFNTAFHYPICALTLLPIFTYYSLPRRVAWTRQVLQVLSGERRDLHR